MANDLTRKEKLAALSLAKKAVSIPEGEKVGKWTRETRVALVYSVICTLVRIAKNKKKLSTLSVDKD